MHLNTCSIFAIMISISDPWSWWLIVGAQVTVELLADVGMVAPPPEDTLPIPEQAERDACLAFRADVSSICSSSQRTFSSATYGFLEFNTIE